MKTITKNLGFVALLAAVMLAFAFKAAPSFANTYEYISEDATSYTVGLDVTGQTEGEHFLCIEEENDKCLVNSPVAATNGIVLKSSGATAGPIDENFVDIP